MLYTVSTQLHEKLVCKSRYMYYQVHTVDCLVDKLQLTFTILVSTSAAIENVTFQMLNSTVYKPRWSMLSCASPDSSSKAARVM